MDEIDSGQSVKIELEVTQETASDLQALIAEQGLEYAEGLRRILGAGMAALRAESAQKAPAAGDEKAELIQRMRKRMVETESNLAVTRFRLFEALKTIQNWELSSGATLNQNIGYQGLIQRQKEEIESLLARLQELEQQLSQQTSLGQSETQPLSRAEQPAHRSWMERLSAWLKSP